jgi:hypothetical protein
MLLHRRCSRTQQAEAAASMKRKRLLAITLADRLAIIMADRLCEWMRRFDKLPQREILMLKTILVSLLPVILVLLGVGVWLFLRKSIRTRLRMAQQLKDDPQVNDWLVVFAWSRKVLYIPTVIASLLAAGLMYMFQARPDWFNPDLPHILGGAWLAVFFINFLIDEYEINLKVLLLVVLAVAVLCLWLTLMGWLTGFLHFFKRLGVQMDATGFLLMALIFAMAVIVSWVRGLFYYVAMTPNFINIQNGPNETSEQISREAYSTRIDTGDFLERLLGFGQIIITFADTRRSPLTLMVGHIGKKAQRLESVRSHLSVESVNQTNDTGTA